MTTKKVKFSEISGLKGKTKKEELDKLTDEDVEKAAREDQDSALPTDDELKEFKKTNRKYGE